MLRLADTQQLITFDEVRSLTVEVIARELGRVVEVVETIRRPTYDDRKCTITSNDWCATHSNTCLVGLV